MTDPRTALEEAFKVVFPEPPRSWGPMPIQEAIIHPVQSLAVRAHSDWRNKVQGRFYRMLAAEAWTSAAEMLVPDGYDWSMDNFDGELGKPSAWICKGGPFFNGTGDHQALALAAACLKAKEAGDVHHTPA